MYYILLSHFIVIIMIQTENEIKPSGTFLEKFSWKENPQGKWYLDKKQCTPIETDAADDLDIVTFEMAGYEAGQSEEQKIQSNDTVIGELGKHKVNKIEEGQAFLQLEAEELPVPLETIKKILKFNILIVGKTKTFLIDDFELDINKDIGHLKNLLAEYLSLIKELIFIYFKNEEKQDDVLISSLEITEGDTFVASFKSGEEICYKRSTSKDYTWYDQKNFIPFIVDKNIVVSAIGFFRHYDNSPAKYEFFLYEVSESGNKILVSSLSDVKVNPSECDSLCVKKVNISPVLLKANVKYYAYVNFKDPSQRTYYSYYGTADQTISGVRFRMLDQSELGYRSSSTTGHLPYIYFKLDNPYEE